MIAFTIENLKEVIYGPSVETKTEIMLRKAEELGLRVVSFKCQAMTDEYRKGIPRVIETN